MLAVHSTNGPMLQPTGIAKCEVTIDYNLMAHSFTVCKYLTKDLVIALNMQQIHWVGYDWPEEGWMYLHQGWYVHINCLNITKDYLKLQTVSAIQIPAWAIATFLLRQQDLYPRSLLSMRWSLMRAWSPNFLNYACQQLYKWNIR